jgi:hypothetical protein
MPGRYLIRDRGHDCVARNGSTLVVYFCPANTQRISSPSAFPIFRLILPEDHATSQCAQIPNFISFRHQPATVAKECWLRAISGIRGHWKDRRYGQFPFKLSSLGRCVRFLTRVACFARAPHNSVLGVFYCSCCPTY